MIKIQEEKQVGILYHYTSLWRVFSILDMDEIKAMSEDAVCFTRDKNFHRISRDLATDIQARIVIDGNKLSSRYKLTPHNYYDENPEDAIYQIPQRNLEAEERVVGRNITDVRKYIIKVEILSYASRSPSTWKKTYELVKPFIMYGDIPSLEEFTLEYVRDYTKKYFHQPCEILQTSKIKDADRY